jgi:hypothetical protein
MIRTIKSITCDLCNTEETMTVMESRPTTGWRIVMVNQPPSVVQYHICPSCRGQLERMRLIKEEPWAMYSQPINAPLA